MVDVSSSCMTIIQNFMKVDLSFGSKIVRETHTDSMVIS